MKKLFSALLAAALVAASAISASAGMFVFDSSDSEYWDAALNMLDKTQKVFWMEDGAAADYSISVDANSVEYDTNKLSNLESGWYEIVLCDLGTNPEWFPADVAGKVALTLRGDSTFTVKSNNALEAGAIACLVGNNCRDEELIDEEGNVTTGTYQVTNMSVEFETLPMGMISSDVTVRLVSKMTGLSMADTVAAVREVFGGKLELGLEAKNTAWMFFGTEEEYKANTTRTDANTKTGAGAAAPAAPAAAEAPAAAPAAGEWGWVIDENYIVLSDWADVEHAFGDAYPASGEWDWPEVTSGSLLKGTIIAGFNGSSHCWSNGSDNAANAFDGDTETFFDPYEATTNSWAGLLLDQPYELTEIRIAPRSTYSTRLPGAAVQGSNDGVNWTDIVFIDKAATGLTDAPNGVDYHCFTPATNDTYVAANTDLGAAEPDFSVYWVGSGAYQAYRYVNINGEHGDVGEIELYGVPAAAGAAAPAAAEAPAAGAAAPVLTIDFANGAGDVELVNAELVNDSERGQVLQINGVGTSETGASYGLLKTDVFEKTNWENGMTVNMWVKTADSSTLHGTAPIFSLDIANVGYIALTTSLESAINTDGNDTSLGIAPRIWTDPANVGGGINMTEVDTWQMLTVVYNEDHIDLYVDGELFSDHPFANGNATDLTAMFNLMLETNFVYSVRLGSWLCSWWKYGDYEGCIDDFTVYNSYLSADEVAAIYAATKDVEVAAAPEAPAAEAAPAGETIEYAHYVASGNDPYLNYENVIDIDPEVVTWAQIKYRTITEKDSLDNTLTGQIYITPAAEPFIPVKWNHTGNWETIVVDLTSVSETTTLTSLWKDSLGLGFRLDPMESNRDAEANTGDDPAVVLPDSAIDIAYVAFFETEDAAKAFDGVNGAAALITPDVLLAPASSNAVAVEVLSEAVAAPVVEEAPAEEPVVEEVVEEAPVEEEVVVEEPVVEEVVEEVVVEETAEEEVVEEAAQTFDFGVIAAVAAIVSAAGYALSKKR